MKPTRPYLNVRQRTETPASPPAPPDPIPPKRRKRRIASPLAEGGLAILLTLVCFVMLLTVLSRLLPSATDLGKLLAVDGRGGSESRPTSALTGSLAALEEPESWKNVSLSVLDNEVMRKESNSIAWRPARSGASLMEGDGIQTTRAGMAVVTFDKENHFRLGRNSLVILRRPELEDPFRARSATSFTIVSGELWGDFGKSGAPIHVEFPSGSAMTRIDVAGAKKSQFKVIVREDKSSAIAIYRGSAEVNTGGVNVPVKSKQYIIVDAAGAAGAPMSLLDAPGAVKPGPREHRVYREFPPAVAFQWNRIDKAEEYRLLVARDLRFREVVLDDRTPRTTYSLGGLTAGQYWWTLSSIRGGIDGPPSQPRLITIVEDRVPPVLRVNFKETRTRNGTLDLVGMSEPGARVLVGGEPVAIDSEGRFHAVTPLKPGMNLVVVEAVDVAGNTSYRSQEIQRLLLDGDNQIP